jgi:hypothetical protein
LRRYVAARLFVGKRHAALQSLDVATGTAAEAVEAAFGGDVATQIETPMKGPATSPPPRFTARE